MQRLSVLGALLAATVGCDDSPHPTAELHSAHFNLFAYDGAPATETTLAWLEADYRDARAYLNFPEGHVDYHLYPTAAGSGAVCDPNSAEPIPACAIGSSLFTYLALDHHELLHAYMSRVGRPPALLREGIAQGLLCSPAPPSVAGPLPGWSTVAPLPSANQPDVYAAGQALFVYLVNSYGIDRFVAYYGAAGDTQDADVFRDDFESFWGTSLDTVWQEMQVSNRPGGALFPICSCAQPELPVDGTAIDLTTIDTSVLPLPDADRGPFLFAAEVSRGALALMKCAQDFPALQVASVQDKPTGIALARLLPERYYLSVDPTDALTARRGHLIAPTCDAAVPAAVAAGYRGTAEVLIVRAQDDPLEGDWYARFAPADAR